MRYLIVLLLFSCSDKQCLKQAFEVKNLNEQIKNKQHQIDSLIAAPFTIELMERVVNECDNLQLLVLEKEQLLNTDCK